MLSFDAAVFGEERPALEPPEARMALSKEYDLLVFGEINPDLILAGEDIEPAFGQVEKLVDESALTIGSSSAIMACGAARLGLRTAIVGLVGDDLFGHFMLDALAQRGVDVAHVVVDSARRTGFSVILARGSDRAILTFVGTMNALEADHIPDGLIRAASHIHVGSYFLQTALRPALPRLFQHAQEWGTTTSLDTNWDPLARWQGVGELLRYTSLFLPNEAEAYSLTGKEDLPAALSALAGQGPLVAVKLGSRGAIARYRDEVARAEALPLAVKDTVGAGDSFDAGFVYGYLRGWPLARSLQLATVCGSLSVRAHGGTEAQPTLPEALAYLQGNVVEKEPCSRPPSGARA